MARFRLGMFDPPERVPYSKIPYSENDSAAHRQLAREAEREAIVLLKNEGGFLPLSLGEQDRGDRPLGRRSDGLLGNYNGISSQQVTPLEGIEQQFAKAKVQYALGATYTAATPALVDSNFLDAAGRQGRGIAGRVLRQSRFPGRAEAAPRGAARVLRRQHGRARRGGGRHGDKYSIRWTGTLTPPATGDYVISARTGMWNRDGRSSCSSTTKK